MHSNCTAINILYVLAQQGMQIMTGCIALALQHAEVNEHENFGHIQGSLAHIP